MKVQTRLSLYSSLTFGVIFAITSLLIYGLYARNTERNIYNALKKTTYITALFYLEEDELNKEEFAKVQKQFEEIVPNHFYQIYNEIDEISYGTQTVVTPEKYLAIIRERESFAFKENGYFCYGIYYEDNQGDFVVISWESQESVKGQLATLGWILFLAFLLGITAIIFLSKWMAAIAYRPFTTVIKQVNNISTPTLETRIKVPPTKDELQYLVETFNKLLHKIGETFVIQKNFVSYVSHEFKTPLTSILGNLEVFSLKDRSPEEYQELADKLIYQIGQLEEILNTLMVISDLKNNSDVTGLVRMDELVWEIVRKVGEQYQDAKIEVNILVAPEDQSLLTVPKDRTQLLIGIFNLTENAVKYSGGNKVVVEIGKEKEQLYINIMDQGIGIPHEDLQVISRPFYRSENVSSLQGHGIGLSIALRIFEKNGIRYDISSVVDEGTVIRIFF